MPRLNRLAATVFELRVRRWPAAIRRVATVLAMIAALSAAAASPAADWPQWRGELRDGASADTGLARQWPAGGPRLLWTARNLGAGFSTPSVSAQSAYLLGERDGREWLVAIAIADGRIQWQTDMGAVRHSGTGYPGPRSTPTVSGGQVVALGLAGDLVSVDAADGRVLWRRDLVKDFGGAAPTWGYSESALCDGGLVVCTPGGAEATLVALSAERGDVVWKSTIGDGAAYSSIIAAQLAGAKQYVQFTAQGVVGVDARDGRLLWRYDRPSNFTANVATPVAVDDAVFAASGYGAGGGLVRIARQGERFTATEAFFTREMKNHHGGVVVRDGFVYGSDDPGILTCIDLETGRSAWRERGVGKCSITLADGMLICRNEKGVVSLVEATHAEFRLLGEFQEPDRSDSPAWPHPALADGRMYLRDQELLRCYDLRSE